MSVANQMSMQECKQEMQIQCRDLALAPMEGISAGNVAVGDIERMNVHPHMPWDKTGDDAN